MFSRRYLNFWAHSENLDIDGIMIIKFILKNKV